MSYAHMGQRDADELVIRLKGSKRCITLITNSEYVNTEHVAFVECDAVP